MCATRIAAERAQLAEQAGSCERGMDLISKGKPVEIQWLLVDLPDSERV